MNVHYDQKDGLGSVPDNQIVNYKGFKCWMYPDMFLKLARRIYIDPQDTRFLFLKNAIRKGRPIGSPFLSVTWDESKPVWEVGDHEGRHRVQAIKELWPTEIVEVHIFPYGGLRARDITPDMIQSFMEGVVAEDKTYVKNPTSKIELNGKIINPNQPIVESILLEGVKGLVGIWDDYEINYVEGDLGREGHEQHNWMARPGVLLWRYRPDNKILYYHAMDTNDKALQHIAINEVLHFLKKKGHNILGYKRITLNNADEAHGMSESKESNSKDPFDVYRLSKMDELLALDIIKKDLIPKAVKNYNYCFSPHLNLKNIFRTLKKVHQSSASSDEEPLAGVTYTVIIGKMIYSYRIFKNNNGQLKIDDRVLGETINVYERL